jgi:VWFA-related protein
VRIALLLLASTLTAAPPTNAASTERMVFVTVADNQGAPVADLAPADFVVKEGGKEREILKAEPASARMRLALAIEERMVADTAVRTGIFEFMKRVASVAEISLITIGLRNTTVVDYTSSLEALVGGINKFTLNPAKESSIAEGILELSNRIADAKPQRPVIIVVSLSGGQSGVDPRTVLDKLRQSGATMFAATLAGGDSAAPNLGSMNDHSGREQVLGDGPKQSGGRRIDVTTTGAIPKALQQIANDLQSQYAITYALPDGTKPDRRLNVSVKRRGLTLRSPSAIPDR